MKLNLGQDSEARFGQDFEFYFIGDAGVWLRSWYLVMILKMNLIKIYVWTSDMTSSSYFDKMNSTLGSVVPLAMFLKYYLDLLREIHTDCFRLELSSIEQALMQRYQAWLFGSGENTECFFTGS